MRDVGRLTEEQGGVLLEVARESLEEAFGLGRVPERNAAWLLEEGASFVTLTQEGALRGCLGSVRPRRSLLEDVRTNALGAAFRDVRFPSLVVEELPGTRIEVSVLSPLERLEIGSEEELLLQLRPGRDGLLLAYRHSTATFLPQVWEQLAEPREFVGRLKRKAGLGADFWAVGIDLWRYTVASWEERDRER
jgi:AmmeMemoRadiSam system protein A